MSELRPTINWNDLVKIVKSGRIEELQSCEVLFNCIPIFTAIIAHGDAIDKDNMRTLAEYLAMKSNIIGGVDPSELKEKNSVAV